MYENPVVKNSELRSVFTETSEGYLENISFTVDAGGTFVVLVPEKHERDALLKALIGLTDLSSGKIFYQGEDITRLSFPNRLEKGISVILTREEGKSFPIDQRVMHENSIGYAKFLLTDSWSFFPWMGERKSFNRFRKQHVCFRKGTVGSQLLIATHYRGESVDAKELYRHMLYTLMEMKNQGITLILLTDDLENLLGIADQVCMIKEGRVVGLVNNEVPIRNEIKRWEKRAGFGR
jgi:ABC-type sugar transport system ATPase subunit